MRRFLIVSMVVAFGCQDTEQKPNGDGTPTEVEDTSTPTDDGGDTTATGGEGDDTSSTDGGDEGTGTTGGSTDDTSASSTDDTSASSTDDTSASSTDDTSASSTDTADTADTAATSTDSGDTGIIGGGSSGGSIGGDSTDGGSTGDDGDTVGEDGSTDEGTSSDDADGSEAGGETGDDGASGGDDGGDGGTSIDTGSSPDTGDSADTGAPSDTGDDDPDLILPEPGVEITTLCVGEPDPLDLDCDGLTNIDEATWGTDPENPDTDGDWVIDSDDNRDGRLPTRPELLQITLNEGATDSFKLYRQLQKQTMDVAFLLDTTCSMGSTAEALAGEFTTMVAELEADLGSTVAIRYGFATYDDYATTPFGDISYGDKPFILRNSITNDVGAVLREMESVELHAGADGPESTMEALFQGLTGRGYDQNCDGMYDATTDVAPFLAMPRDIFSGSVSIMGSIIPTDDETDVDTGEVSFSSVTSTGGGLTGGFGFNSWSQPVIVYATDNELRDPDSGYAVPDGCPTDAGSSQVAAAAFERDAKIIGIASGGSDSAFFVEQMKSLAEQTNSMYDSTGDGTDDAHLVYNWSTDSADDLRGLLVDALTTIATSEGALSAATRFDSVTATVEGDAEGFISRIDTASVADVDLGSEPPSAIDFALNFEGAVPRTSVTQVYDFAVVLVGDDGTELNTLPIQIVVPGYSSDADGDGVEWSEDCDDANPLIGAARNDYDCDGTVRESDCDDSDPESTTVATDEDCDAVITEEDCDDTSTELGAIAEDGDCDSVLTEDDCDDSDPESTTKIEDTDCDGILAFYDCDDTDPTTVSDMDCDGWTLDVDCDDENPEINPDAIDYCDEIDNDCDGEIDEEEDILFYPDFDYDGFGDPDGETVTGCIAPDRYTADNTDCDDTNYRISPDGEEECNGLDDDCDGSLDEDFDTFSFYLDEDGDGFGSDSETLACEAPPEHVENKDDCNDADALINPEAIADCDDDADNDCDGEVDEGPFDTVFYADVDGDGFGDPASTMAACEASEGWVLDSTDCDDDAVEVYPGKREDCSNEIDDNCNGDIDELDRDCMCPDHGYVEDEDLGSRTGERVATGSTSTSEDDYYRGSCGSSGARDDFYRFTAPVDGCYTFDTNGSSYDTLLRILDACEGDELACDDDDGISTQSLIDQYAMNAGDDVFIVVDGYNVGASGDYILNIDYTSYGDDGFAESPVLPFDLDILDEIGLEFLTGSTEDFANDYSSECGGDEAPDVALLWTAPSTGSYVFDTIGSDYDTMLALYDADRSIVTDTEPCTADFTEALTCNDDGEDIDTMSEMFYDVIAGEQYIIVIDGYASSAGEYKLTIYET